MSQIPSEELRGVFSGVEEINNGGEPMTKFKKPTDSDWGKKLVDLDVLDGLEQTNKALNAVVGLLCGEVPLEGVGTDDLYCLLDMIHREFDLNLRKTDG